MIVAAVWGCASQEQKQAITVAGGYLPTILVDGDSMTTPGEATPYMTITLNPSLPSQVSVLEGITDLNALPEEAAERHAMLILPEPSTWAGSRMPVIEPDPNTIYTMPLVDPAPSQSTRVSPYRAPLRSNEGDEER
jgi:hypothetical protein